MNPYLIIAALLGVLGAGYGGFRLGVDHEVAAQAREDQHIAQAVDAANGAAAAAIAKLVPKNTTIRQTLEKEIHENTVYRDCKSSDSVVREFNAGIDAAPGPAGGGKLPAAHADK